MERNQHYFVQPNDNENASFMPMSNQMISPEALYSTPPDLPLMNSRLHIDTSNQMSNSMNYMYYEPNITTTPIVKSHHPNIYSPPIGSFQQQQQTNNNNLNSMEIDDYFTPPVFQSLYSPISNSNNSSVMFIDNCMSPISPNNMSPTATSNPNNIINPDFSNIDSFVSSNYSNQQPFVIPDNSMMDIYQETPIVPTHLYSRLPYDDPRYYLDNRKQNTSRTSIPRRHTVSIPYHNQPIKGKDSAESINKQSDPTKPPTRKSSLKAKRHKSLSKLNVFSHSSSSPPPVPDTPLSAQLETWSHEKLLLRVKELEKEKQVAQTKYQFKDEPNMNTSKPYKVRSASHTDTEFEEEEEELVDDGPHVCKWEVCTLEFNSLNDLINHVKTEHIGSGKANYYCGWKDCARKQKPFTKKHKMHNHLRTHTGERPFACEEPDCGKRFSRLDSLTTHSKIHSNVRPYICSVGECGKAYYHLRSLRKHERSHSQTEEPLVPSHLTQPDLPTQEPFSDWGLSAQAALLNAFERHQY